MATGYHPAGGVPAPGTDESPGPSPRLTGGQVEHAPWAESGLAAIPHGRLIHLDTHDEKAQGVAAATGEAILSIGPVPHDRVWDVERILVTAASVAMPTALVYLDVVNPLNLKCILPPLVPTPAGLFVAQEDSNNAMRMPAFGLLVIDFTGATAGAVCTARVQLSEKVPI